MITRKLIRLDGDHRIHLLLLHEVGDICVYELSSGETVAMEDWDYETGYGLDHGYSLGDPIPPWGKS